MGKVWRTYFASRRSCRPLKGNEMNQFFVVFHGDKPNIKYTGCTVTIHESGALIIAKNNKKDVYRINVQIVDIHANGVWKSVVTEE